MTRGYKFSSSLAIETNEPLILGRFGQEAGENGRVWKIYKESMKQHDDASFEAWKDTLDVLLVFVSIFIVQKFVSHYLFSPVSSRRC